MKKALFILALIMGNYFNGTAQNIRLWGTYYGGNLLEGGFNTTTDAMGNVYLTGQTESLTGIASGGAFQTTHGGAYDAFLVKFDAAGNRLWGTYYGGSGSDYGYAVKTDALGNVYMCGYTSSTDSIATAGSHQSTFNGTTDAFLVKFDASGNRLWATYYGGSDFELGQSVAVDPVGNVYMTGYTVSTTDISTPGSHQPTSGGFADGFIVKFNSSGVRQWGTFYGGTDQDYLTDISVDVSGNIVVCGGTSSTSGIASPGSYQTSIAGFQDAMIAKFDNNGVRLWSTYYGGIQQEDCNGIATGAGGVIYIAGNTQSSSGISTFGSFQSTFGGFTDAYLVKFDALGNRVWGTYYGGSAIEEGSDVAVDPWDRVFLIGDSYSPNGANIISTPMGYQSNLIGAENNFIAAFLPSGLRVIGTYYGTVHEEESHLSISPLGELYLSGWSHATTGIASPGGFQSTFGGGTWDAFLVKFKNAIPHEDVVVPNDTIPPTPTVYFPPKEWRAISIFRNSTAQITNFSIKNFSPGTQPPVSGSAIISFACDFTAQYFDGSSTIPIQGTANLMMKLTHSSTSGPIRVYDTELLAMNVETDTTILPLKIKIRESPTFVSPGVITLSDIGSGNYRLMSCFDVYAELSLDDGQSWQATDEPRARLTMQDDVINSVPTMSEWGLIALSILVLGAGVFFIRRR